MIDYELIPNGVRKLFDWGYSEVYGADVDCFTPHEADAVISKLSALPLDALSERERLLLEALKAKRRA